MAICTFQYLNSVIESYNKLWEVLSYRLFYLLTILLEFLTARSFAINAFKWMSWQIMCIFWRTNLLCERQLLRNLLSEFKSLFTFWTIHDPLVLIWGISYLNCQPKHGLYLSRATCTQHYRQILNSPPDALDPWYFGSAIFVSFWSFKEQCDTLSSSPWEDHWKFYTLTDRL